MNVKGTIWKFVRKRQTFTLPMLQKELNLSYAEVKNAVDELAHSDKVKFESGLEYRVISGAGADDESARAEKSRDDLNSLFFRDKAGRDAVDFDDEEPDDEENDFDEELEDNEDDASAKISELRKRLNEEIEKVDRRNGYDDDSDDDFDDFRDFDGENDDIDFEDRDFDIVEEDDAAGGEDFPENTDEEETVIERIVSEGEAFDGYTGSGYEWLPECSAGYRRLVLRRYDEMCGDKRYLLTPQMIEDVRNRLDTEFQEMFFDEPDCADGVKMEFFSMLILPHGRSLRFSLFRKAKGEYLLRTKIFADPQTLEELCYRRDFYFILKRHGAASRGNYFYLPFDHSASVQTAIINLYAALCEFFLLFKEELN